MSQGVTLLAIGGPDYGIWAYQLARTIKALNPDVPIQLVYSPTAVSQFHDGLWEPFDIRTTIEEEHAYTEYKVRRNTELRLNPSWAKLNLYEYYAFDKTIYLDVDAQCVNDFTHLFDLSGFKIHTWGITDQKDGEFGNMLWMLIDKMRETFDLSGTIPGTNSSFQLIEKGEQSEGVYSRALAAYKHFDENCTTEDLHMKWGRKVGGYVFPDELFFNVALSGMSGFEKNVVYFHTTKTPGPPIPHEILENGYKFLGLWGDKWYNHIALRKLYDRWYRQTTGEHPLINCERLLKTKFVNQNVLRKTKKAPAQA